MSKYVFFSCPYFTVFTPNMGKYGTENTPYLDFFYAVLAEISVVPNVRSSLIVSVNISKR